VSDPRKTKDTIRVLYVDDEEDHWTIMKHFLEEFEQSLKIEFTDSPATVPLRLAEEAFDAIISDYVMPGMDGIELGELVRELRDIPFIIYTGRGSEDIATEAFKRGIDDYVRKEPNPDHYRLLALRLTEAVKRRRARRNNRAASQILRLLDQDIDLPACLGEIMLVVKESFDVEAVGIRLQRGDDYPYYVFDGFHDSHVIVENELCAYDLEGQLMRDDVGNPVLDCMCGNILRGRFDPSKPFFTVGGSFWSNSTSDLLASTTDEDRLARTRNTCNAEGYESVALIPIRGGGETLGLLQLNDHRPGCFDPETIGYLEGIADTVGTVLEGIQEKQGARETVERYRTLLGSIPQPLLVIDPDELTILEANEAAARAARLTKDGLIGRTCHEILAGNDTPCELLGEECPIIQMLEKGGESVTCVCPRRDGLGDYTLIEEAVSPVRNDDGVIDLVILSFRGLDGRRVTP